MSEVFAAVDKLTDCILQADTIGQALEDASGENSLSWVFVYRQQIEAIRAASETLECLLRGVAP
jgi:hypothetical protein